ncbi:C40 family peptidase [Butyrivibrio sp. INlla16]|uniref:C40 family peptidase n=1 Tax=Butyrivibrio sp. INlla16 TaxID=1520807 RepID=UPI000891B303|nr:C40 family peptidase [Butyrivibrio sp. INlla16]SDB04440.1 Cell wall-associated hydrolase, NlpC family [Butyrivibrio sp. INlla16]
MDLNDRAHFRDKFRTKSTIEAEYGKKLKRRGCGVEASDAAADPERKKILKGRLESKEMLGVKAQMKAESAKVKAMQVAEGVARAGTAVIGTASAVVAAGSSDCRDDKNVSGDVVHEGANAVHEATDKINEGLYQRKLRREHKEEKRHSNEQNPRDGSNAKSRAAQKKKTRKSYYQKEKERETARKGATMLEDAVNKLSEKMSDVLAAIVNFVKDNPKLLLAILIVVLIIILLSAMVSSCALMIPSISDGTLASTYTAYDEDILGIETDYRKLEKDLKKKIDDTETLYPDYDEYEYELDEIGHNPYELITYLTVKYDDFKRKDMKDIIKALFEKQYKLTYKSWTETRTRTVEKTGLRWVDDDSYEDGGYYEDYTYEEEEEYTVKILKVKLDNRSLGRVIEEMGLTDKQQSHYDLLLYTKGNKEYLFADIYTDLENPEDYHVPGDALTDHQFALMIAEAEKYLGREYVWGGSNPTTGFDCSGYVCWVLNHCGYNVGRTTAQGLRKRSAYVSPADARPGDLIFFQRTYDTPGASHVGIYVGNGMMIHCGNPISYTSINTKYWQQHFLCFGRP